MYEVDIQKCGNNHGFFSLNKAVRFSFKNFSFKNNRRGSTWNLSSGAFCFHGAFNGGFKRADAYHLAYDGILSRVE